MKKKNNNKTTLSKLVFSLVERKNTIPHSFETLNGGHLSLTTNIKFSTQIHQLIMENFI
jgi:hypothetical protein